MNTVGPYHNRQETYNYFSLPFCRGTKREISHYHETLGENILGVELEYSGVEINFKRRISRMAQHIGLDTIVDLCRSRRFAEDRDLFDHDHTERLRYVDVRR
jgi:hypothetical protein